jgi:hypothetical protein
MYTGMSATQFAALLAPLPPAQQIVLIEMLLQRERLVSASGNELPAISTAQSRRLEKRRREREERAARTVAA